MLGGCSCDVARVIVPLPDEPGVMLELCPECGTARTRPVTSGHSSSITPLKSRYRAKCLTRLAPVDILARRQATHSEAPKVRRHSRSPVATSTSDNDSQGASPLWT